MKKYSEIRGKKTNYLTLRKDIITGDLLFTAHPKSKMVRDVTQSDYSHVGVLVWIGKGTDKRLIIFENSGENGIFIGIPASNRIKKAKATGDKLFVGRVAPAHLNDKDISDEKIEARAWDRVGNEYPKKWELIKGLFIPRDKKRIRSWCNENAESILGVYYNSTQKHRATNPSDLAEKCGNIVSLN